MIKLKEIVVIVLIAACSLSAQGLTIGNGTTLSLGETTLTLTDGWTNEGTFEPDAGTIIFGGTGGDQSILNSTGETFFNVTVNKSTGNLVLGSNVTINGILTVTSGDLDLNGKTLTLGSGASLSETDGNTVGGTSGTITTMRSLNAPTALNVGGLGAIITSPSDLGSTVITRGHKAQTGGENTGMLRYYDISPENNSGVNAQLTFCYDDSELSGITESELCLFKSEDGGANWTSVGGTCNTTTNEISISGIDSFSRWTAAGSSSPLPVELAYFEGYNTSEGVVLNWETATEVNNYGFQVQRKKEKDQSESAWENVGFVQGHGTTNSPKHYEFTDSELPNSETVDYRLKQIDNDGTFAYSKVVTVELTTITSINDEEIPTIYSLDQNYPNPFNPSTTIKFGLPERGVVDLRVYNLLGEEVARLVNKELNAGYHEVQFDASSLASGMYFYRIDVGNEFSSIKKMLMVK